MCLGLSVKTWTPPLEAPRGGAEVPRRPGRRSSAPAPSNGRGDDLQVVGTVEGRKEGLGVGGVSLEIRPGGQKSLATFSARGKLH